MLTPEADLILSYSPQAMLDAGCGTGRVAIEVARRGVEVVGVDISPEMVGKARAAAPHLDWRLSDLAVVQLHRRFDVIVMAGNVVIFLKRESEQQVVQNMARHLAPNGLLIAGFQRSMDRAYVTLEEYDSIASTAGLALRERYSGWDRAPWRWDSPFSVSVHQLLVDG